jgi:signal transduction histidine kinase
MTIAVASSDDLAALRAKVESLTRQLEDLARARAIDRQLVTYDIHDGLVQDITGAAMQLESIDRANIADPKSRAALDKAAALLHEAIADARRLVSGTRVPALEQEGLAIAIDQLVDVSCRAAGIEVEFLSQLPPLPPGQLDPVLEDTLYRIAQESLGNLCRHSGTQRAQVTLDAEGNQLRLVVRDWGRGFDPAAVPAQRFGLEGIRKRAELAGGRAEIHSAPGQGTTITVELPCRL